ncbi:MAG: hypothetical protein ABI169_08910, partial [Chitinophagaceae bacterium]
GNFIEFTGDHQIWASDKRRKDGGEYGWQMLQKLLGKKVQQTALSNVASDLELVAEMAAEANAAGNHFQFTKTLGNTPSENSASELALENEDAYAKASLAGWIVSDGYYGKYSQNNKTTMFGAITINDDEYAQVTKLFQTLFGGYKTVTRRNINDLYHIVKFDSKAVDPFVAEYELNQNSQNAHVSERIMNGSMA